MIELILVNEPIGKVVLWTIGEPLLLYAALYITRQSSALYIRALYRLKRRLHASRLPCNRKLTIKTQPVNQNN